MSVLAQALVASYGAGGPPAGGPLDLPGLWAAYGISRLIDNYSGPALKARRSSDNATRDIGFNGSFTDLDTADLATWAGSDSVFVERWYDQKNSNDFLQSTTNYQPRIVNAGVYDGFIRFDGSDDVMASVANSGTPAAITTAFRAWSRSNTTGIFIEKGPDINTTNGSYILTLNNSGTNVLRMGVSANQSGATGQFVVWNATSNPTTSEAAWVVRYDRSLSTASNYAAWRAAWRDGTSQTVAHASTSLNPGAQTTFLANAYYIGARSSRALPGPVNFKSLVIYESNRDADVSTITAEL
ncbi:MAG: arabinofuranosidase catalytic domain-containing protein [Hydrogenophaga sp.]|uniref:arabinofuranosidase catalytic domain-containing protein n=1 Tax=Hydrogenophaga sp. TaxID=1904254 RepID=UPI0027354EA7|nr:arabinofuranosidase catalytic domain-containing protein [Hydrogenophaga sp.]MDP3625009.1 arabinofuranosidase catalytic domain-containing protein [Hydrogenophaga sp.]